MAKQIGADIAMLERDDEDGAILLDGQYTSPMRVVGFNVAEGWSRDVSEDIADEIRRRCDMQMMEVPAHLEAFVEGTRTKIGDS